jgi:hypothetical protein
MKITATRSGMIKSDYMIIELLCAKKFKSETIISYYPKKRYELHYFNTIKKLLSKEAHRESSVWLSNKFRSLAEVNKFISRKERR